MLDNNKTFFLPIMSDNEPAGRLTRIPGIVDAAATKPSRWSGVPTNVAKGFSTGFFDIVELKIAKNPIMHSIKKKLATELLDTLFGFVIILEPFLLVKFESDYFFFTSSSSLRIQISVFYPFSPILSYTFRVGF